MTESALIDDANKFRVMGKRPYFMGLCQANADIMSSLMLVDTLRHQQVVHQHAEFRLPVAISPRNAAVVKRVHALTGLRTDCSSGLCLAFNLSPRAQACARALLSSSPLIARLMNREHYE